MSKHNSSVSDWQKSALSAGATADHLRPDKLVTSSVAASSPSSKRSSRQSSISSRSSHSSRARGTRTTDTFVLFWGGALSNWNMGTRFSGQRAIDTLFPRLDDIAAPRPSYQRFATQMLANHNFSCGEQWMMACKAWLFETTLYGLAGQDHSPLNFKEIKHRLMLPTPPEDPLEKAFHGSTLCRILRATNPRDHKELGRHTPNFSEEEWNLASTPIVVAGSVARAEADKALAEIYWANIDGKRKFVEGSPHDRIWGVGISWDDRRIEQQANWRGENRLGTCHDEACRVYCTDRENRESGLKVEKLETGADWNAKQTVRESDQGRS